MKTDSRQVVRQVLTEAGAQVLSDGLKLAWMIERAFQLGAKSPSGRGQSRSRVSKRKDR